MSLFQFGFTIANSSTTNEPEVTATTSYMPQQAESGLGSDEYTNVATAVSDLANPEPAAKKKDLRQIYKVFICKSANIGRYASENGIMKATRHFLGDFPHITESAIRNFKKLYLQKMRDKRMKANPQLVTKLAVKPRA